MSSRSVIWGNFKAEVISGDEIHSSFQGSDEIAFDSTEGLYVWKLRENISAYPEYKSDTVIVDALYKMSLGELEKLKTKDGLFFNAGAKWYGVWTRDVSYSILLSLAVIAPEISKRSLMKRVDNGKIIQDTGTGGSWPVSSDRMIWALAAWEVYKVTGDKKWLENIYSIIKKSVQTDIKTIFSPDGLVSGESTFLDWREQTYPEWMQPIDIYHSVALGTNAVHYQTYNILYKISKLLNQPSEEYKLIAERLKKEINDKLWLAKRGYYAQYLYGRHYMSVSKRSEALGEALSVLFDIADRQQQSSVIENTPVVDYGIPIIYPEIPGIRPYHNNAIWPFVQAYWNLAAAKVKNEKALKNGLASIYRAAALFLTNKENMVAGNGNSKGTAINSDRQLWSVAGNIAMVYRIFAGMQFEPDKLIFHPVIPEEYGSDRIIENFKYRNAVLNIRIRGYGTIIDSFKVNGKEQTLPEISGDISGNYNIEIKMANNDFNPSRINLRKLKFSTKTPKIILKGEQLIWNAIPNAKVYEIYKNGQLIKTQKDTAYKIEDRTNYAEYQVKCVGRNNPESFLSNPVVLENASIIEVESFTAKSNLPFKNFSGKGFVELSLKKNLKIEIPVNITETGNYLISFRYSNGAGRMCCTNKCGLRTLSIDKKTIGTIVFPVIVKDEWSEWGFSNSFPVKLNKGHHLFKIKYNDYNENMNGKVNRVMLDYLKLVKL
ncbi:MAG: glycogen debranching protein [Spirochaetes bacterium]|nr:glycogen debranching protein [Spirochaetota bacterium]